MKSLPMKLLSIFLVLVLLVNMLPMGVFAQEVREDILSTENQAEQAEDAEETSEASDPEIVAELADQRTEFSKTFRMDNGLTMALIYPDPIHYEKEGEWADIDNTLVAAENGSYTNTDGVWDVSFPEQLDGGNSVVIEKDGYTLSFSMAGQLTTQLSTARTSTMTAQLAQASEAQIQQKESAEIKTAEQALEKLQSRVRYDDVYEDTDIVYDLESNKVKESVILESYNSALQGYRYILNVGEMTPVVEEDGQISFYDPTGENLIMVMPAPFLVDDANVHNYDVEVTLSGSGSRYILTYLLPQQWLAAEDRAWPVVLDPIVTPALTTSNIRDRTVASNATYSVSSGVNQTGYLPGSGILRTYLKYDQLPTLTHSQSIAEATLTMYKTHTTAAQAVVEAHKVNATWDSNTITWANKPAYNPMIEDYVIAKEERFYSWNITGIVREWYDTNRNTGLMLRSETSAENSTSQNLMQFCSSDYSDYHNLKPILAIFFRHNNGIEPYYTYQTLSAGHAGSAYICDATGQLKVEKNIASYASTVNPFNLNLVYNSDYFAQDGSASDGIKDIHDINMLFGNGFTMNIIQSVEQANINNPEYEYLVWHDGDGTDHYFCREKNTTGEYKDEDGLGLSITVSGSDYTMKDDQGYTRFFDDGLLSEMTDETGNKIIIKWQGSGSSRWFYNIVQKNKYGSEITVATVTYKSGTSYISSLTDAAGRKYTFTYDNSNNLTAIYLAGTQIARYDYLKVNDVPTNRLVGMQDMESSYWLWFEYSGGKVKTYQEWMDSNTSGAIVKATYGNNVTTYRSYGADREEGNGDDIITHYAFDYTGRTVNVCSEDEYGNVLGAGNATYTGTGATENPRQNNRTLRTASIGVAAQNLLTNHSFESNTSGWTLYGNGSTAIMQSATDVYRSGYQSLKGQMPDNYNSSISASTSAILEKNTTYTLSAYVNTSVIEKFKSGGIRLIASSGKDGTWNGEFLDYSTETISGKWTRISLTFKTTDGGYYTLMVQALGIAGKFYVDDVQLEAAEAPSNYNLLENSTFDEGDSGWLTQQGAYSGSAYNNDLMKAVGDPRKDACAWQNVKLNLPGTETYVLSGWGWADSVPDNDSAQTNENYAGDTTKSFGLRATVRYTDGTEEHHYVPFSPDVKQWQFASVTVVPKEPTKTVGYIQVVCAYEKNANEAWFDKLSLVREAAQSMRYDDEGNLISVTTTGMDEQTATYDNGNLLEAYTGGSGKYTYEYDETYKHRVTSATEDALKQKYTYDGNGNVTGTTLQYKDNENASLSTTATYISGGNLQSKITDANGDSVEYVYNGSFYKALGLPTSVTDGNGTTTYKGYDNFGRDRSSSLTNYDANGVANSARVEYTYSKGLLTGVIRNNTQTYGFEYDTWGNRTAVKIGTLELATYTFADKNGNLESMTYGNDEKVSYTYDHLDRVKTQTNTAADGTVQRVLTYTYTGDGQLYSVHDSKTETTQYCTYDALGRVVASQHGSMTTSYEYDEYARLVRRSFTDKVLGDGIERYTYDATDNNGISNGTLTSMRMISGGTINYQYDGLQRLTNKDIAGEVWEAFSYSNTQVTQKLNYIGDSQIQTLLYTYDGNGNITKDTLVDKTPQEDAEEDSEEGTEEGTEEDSETDGKTITTRTYTYDKLNQLIEVKENGVVKESYAYDGYGNITSFSNGKNSHTLAYGNDQWKDLLTTVTKNGQPHTITYDDIGNPLTYYNGYSLNYYFTWTEGRRLKTYTYNDETTAYEYDYTGLRTKKTNPDGTYTVYHIADGRYIGETQYGSDNIPDLYIRYIYDENESVTGISLWYAGVSNGWDNYYFIKNLQGDVLRVYRASDNSLAAKYTYDAWGNVLSATGNLATINPFRYRGYYFDNETYFYYLQSRYYDPAIGRFVNADVLASTGQGILGHNMFAYCNNNPVNRIDSEGTSSAVVSASDLNWQEILNNLSSYGSAAVAGVAACGAQLLCAVMVVGVALLCTGSEARDTTKDVAITAQAPPDENRDYTVYYLRSANSPCKDIVYVGRVKTINFNARMSYHKSQGREHVKHVDGLTYSECRALEQAGMIYYHSIRRGDPAYNQINGIGPRNDEGTSYYRSLLRLTQMDPSKDCGLPSSYIQNFLENEMLNLGN